MSPVLFGGDAFVVIAGVVTSAAEGVAPVVAGTAVVRVVADDS